MNFFVQVMLPALDFFYQFTNNYGLAIIILTIVIKAAFWSMTAKQYESMEAIKKIQPKIKALQEKFRQEPEKMQKEIMVLYKEHGVNPLGGCLPLLIQLPFLIALFSTLSSKDFLAKTAGKAFFWIKDISFPETMNFAEVLKNSNHLMYAHVLQIGQTGFNSLFVFGTNALPLLAILVGISTYFSQKFMSAEPEQQKMMAFMPILMVFICLNLNAGVLLYWIVSNFLTAYQQYYMKKQKYVKEEIAIAEIDIPNPKKK